MACIIRRAYKVKLPNGQTETHKCDHWTIQYRDAAGRIQRVKGYKDKGATKQLAAKLEKNVERGEQGLIDPHKAQKARPLAEHIAEYVADLRAEGRDELYVYNAEHRLNILAEGCQWATLVDIEPNSFCRWRDAQSQEHVAPGRMGKGASATTLNQYLDTARAFTNWCATMGRIDGVPLQRRRRDNRPAKMALALASVGKVKGPKRRNRRALTDEQVQKLLAVAGGRALVYRIGLSIGLRRSELAALLWGDLHLAAIHPYAQLRAEATKGRRGDRLDIPRTLADDLRQHRPKDAKDSDCVFAEIPDIETWRADLAAAGIPYKDEMGRQVDFHGGTRKTMCSRMHKAGVPLAVAMRRMRHTDAKLTMVDYTDEAAIGMEAGVLPEVTAAPAPMPAQATATA